MRSAKFRSKSEVIAPGHGHGWQWFAWVSAQFKRPRFMSWVYVSDLPVARVLASCFGSWYLVARVLATYSGAQELPHGGGSPQLNRLRLDNYYANAPGPEVPTCGDKEENGSAKARRARGLQGKCFFSWGIGTTPNCLRVLSRKRESKIEKQSPRRMPSITRNGDPWSQ